MFDSDGVTQITLFKYVTLLNTTKFDMDSNQDPITNSLMNVLNKTSNKCVNLEE